MGLGVLIIAAPVTGVFVGIMTQQREDMLAYTDKRIVLVNQLLAGIKALKTYAWEAAQEARVRARAWAPALQNLHGMPGAWLLAPCWEHCDHPRSSMCAT